jgi:hypothetical protein
MMRIVKSDTLPDQFTCCLFDTGVERAAAQYDQQGQADAHPRSQQGPPATPPAFRPGRFGRDLRTDQADEQDQVHARWRQGPVEASGKKVVV